MKEFNRIHNSILQDKNIFLLTFNEENNIINSILSEKQLNSFEIQNKKLIFDKIGNKK